MKKISLKISTKTAIKYSFFLVATVSLAAVLYTGIFLYNNFYLIITQSEEVVMLKQKLAIESINITRFQAIIDRIKTKTESFPPENVKPIMR